MFIYIESKIKRVIACRHCNNYTTSTKSYITRRGLLYDGFKNYKPYTESNSIQLTLNL